MARVVEGIGGEYANCFRVQYTWYRWYVQMCLIFTVSDSRCWVYVCRPADIYFRDSRVYSGARKMALGNLVTIKILRKSLRNIILTSRSSHVHRSTRHRTTWLVYDPTVLILLYVCIYILDLWNEILGKIRLFAPFATNKNCHLIAVWCILGQFSDPFPCAAVLPIDTKHTKPSNVIICCWYISSQFALFANKYI